MFRVAAAIAAGFLAWLLTAALVVFGVAIFWDVSPDAPLGIVIISFVGTTVGLIFAELVRERLCRSFAERHFIIIVSVLIGLWVVLPLIVTPGVGTSHWSLVGHTAAIAIAVLRASKPVTRAA